MVGPLTSASDAAGPVLAALDVEFCLRLTAALGHFLWQGTVVALLVAGARPLLANCAAHTRYAVLCGALAVMAACPIVTFSLLGRAARVLPLAALPNDNAAPQTISIVPPAESIATEDALTRAAVDVADDGEPTSASPNAPLARALATDTDHSRAAPANRAAASISTAIVAPQRPSRWEYLAPYMTSVYLVGVALMVARLLLGLHGGQRLSRSCEPVDDPALLTAIARQVKAMGLTFTPAVALCAKVTVPAVVGVLRPMLLLPASLTSGMSIEQIEVLVAHELAHIRRYDHVVNLVQRVIESFLFFHPGVWFVSGQIRLERECCCDERVIATGRAPLAYADLILRVAELHAGAMPEPPAGRVVGSLALAATGNSRPSQLKQRIQRLMHLQDIAAAGDGRPILREDLRLTRRSTALVGSIVTLCLVAPLYFAAYGRPVVDDTGDVERSLVELEEQLRANPAAANAKARADWTRLHEAVVYSDRPEVELLLKFGADPNARTERQWTPLHLAAYFGRLDVVGPLLDRGAELDARARYQRTPLHIAAGLDKPSRDPGPRGQGRETIAQLVGRGADLEARDLYGLTPLLAAAQRKDADVLRYLIELGGDYDAADLKGRTALHYVCVSPHRACIEVLLSAGANVNATDATGTTSLGYLAFSPNPRLSDARDAAALLIRAGARVDLFSAAGLGMHDLAAERAKDGPDVINRRFPAAPASSIRWTPLHLAVYRDDAAMTELLLAGGADPGAGAADGETPLHMAATSGHLRQVELLLAARADPNARMPRGFTPLHLAAVGGHERLIPVLVAAGADVNTTSTAGQTPIHAAAEATPPSPRVIAALLANGANPDLPDGGGRTARQLLQRASDPTLLELLEPRP